VKVILALPRGRRDAGETVDLPAEEARQLVHDGHARYPDAPTSDEPATDGGPEPAGPTTASTRRQKEKE
jgi:hypothetical protein